MILASHGIIASQIASLDADAVAFFNRVTTAGGSLSATEKAAVNQLVLDLKANSLWTAMRAVYPMVGASAAACAQNLKSSSFTGTFTSGWTFASTGINGNGTSSYMTTGLNASTVVSGGGNFFVYTNNNGTNLGSSRDLGLIGTNENGLVVNFGGDTYSLQGNYSAPQQFVTTPFNAANLGFFQANIFGTTNSIVRNNSILNTNTNGFTYFNDTLYLGAAKTFGSTVPTTPSNRRYCFAGVSDGLSNTNLSLFYTAVQAFQTTLSRQV
jgi:hypothetical protein